MSFQSSYLFISVDPTHPYGCLIGYKEKVGLWISLDILLSHAPLFSGGAGQLSSRCAHNRYEPGHGRMKYVDEVACFVSLLRAEAKILKPNQTPKACKLPSYEEQEQ